MWCVVYTAYDDEVAAMVDFCLSQGRERISLFRQDDGFGQAGQTALEIALANQALSILVRGACCALLVRTPLTCCFVIVIDC
jgi:hypothetical protein